MLSIAAVGRRVTGRAPVTRNASRNSGLENPASSLSFAQSNSKYLTSTKKITRSTPSSLASYTTAVKIEPLVAPEPIKYPTSFMVPVINVTTGETSESVELKPSIFGAPVRPDLLHQLVVWHLANKRQGTACTKGRGEVAGSTRKIMNQKGSGNARMGSVRSTQRVGSGAAHGPHPKDWSFKVNKKIRKLAMVSALASKFAKGQLMIVDGLSELKGKTSEAKSMSDKFNWEEGGVLIIGGTSVPSKARLAVRNLGHVDLRTDNGLSVYHILKRKYLVLSKDVLPVLDHHVPL